MKRVIALICAAVALLSCSKESYSPQAVSEIVFDLSASLPDDGSTKAVKTGWETGDIIFVFFSKQATPNYLEMKWTGSKWEMTPHGISLAENENGYMLGVYLPFGSDATVVKSNSYYTFSPAYYSYYLSSRISYQVQNGKVSGRFNMQVPQGYVQFFYNDADAVDGVASLSDARLKPAGIKHIYASASIVEYGDDLVAGDPVPGYVYDKENKTGSEAKGYLFSGILVSEARNTSKNYQFDLVVGGKRYMTSKTGTMYTSASAGRAINITALGWTDVTPQPVDLGLPSGIKWANVNVGAYSEYDYGDFFGWGEVTPYYTKGNNLASGNDIWRPGKENGYNIPSYRHFWSYKNTTDYTYKLYKYCNDKNKGIGNYTDDLVTLEPIDDAATYNWGNPWRTPTKDEITELIENTDYEWTKLGGVNGCRFMKKDDHSVYIFIPITGRRAHIPYAPAGQTALYCMSSSLYTSNAFNAYCLYGYNGVKPYLNYNFRAYGIPVRPVQN